MTTRLLLPALTVVAAGLLTACGSSGAGNPATHPAARPPASGRAITTSSPAASTHSGSSTIDVCSVLPPAQAGRLAGQPYTTGSSATARATGWWSGCTYNNADATVEGVNVNFDAGSRAASTWHLVAGAGYAPVAGLGDKAVWDGDNTLYVLAGSALLQVNGLSSQQRSTALARVVLAAMH